jgi:hypothetical protein
LDCLSKIGITVQPFLFFQEGLCRQPPVDFKDHTRDYHFQFLVESDMTRIAMLPERNVPLKTLLSHLSPNKAKSARREIRRGCKAMETTVFLKPASLFHYILARLWLPVLSAWISMKVPQWAHHNNKGKTRQGLAL